jgi:hypothetical protein
LLVRSKGEASDETLTGVDGTDALEGSMDYGREGREKLFRLVLVPWGGVVEGKRFAQGRVVEREGGTAT